MTYETVRYKLRQSQYHFYLHQYLEFCSKTFIENNVWICDKPDVVEAKSCKTFNLSYVMAAVRTFFK